MLCSKAQVSTSHLQPVLGVVASLLDVIASVSWEQSAGQAGLEYIPLTAGVHPHTSCHMDDDKDLSKSQHIRWLQFPHV